MSQRARLYAASQCATSSAMSLRVPGCSHAGCLLYADCKSLFLAWDNTNGPLSDRSMHRQCSLLQIFFTSEFLDMEAFTGIFHLPPGRADIIYQPPPIKFLAKTRPPQIPHFPPPLPPLLSALSSSPLP